MKYHTLKVYKYMHHLDMKQLKKVYHKRLQSPYTHVTNLKYFVDGYIFPIFYVDIPQLEQMQCIIYQNSIFIMESISKLSRTNQKQLFIHTLGKEIQMTNKIEGLNITDKQITKALSGALNSQKTNQYEPFTKMYLKTNQRKHLQIHHLQDIRDIYNHLFTNVFSKDIIPQHTMFRNTPIRIGSKYTTVYRPKDYEKEFIPDLKDWLKFINSKNYTPLIKAFIAHFYFECTHPFNDGNGRTGRYILSTYLASKIDKYTAVSFAQTIAKHEKTYYKAFQQLDGSLMFGDMTLLLISMFRIVIKSQGFLQSQVKQLLKLNQN